MLRPQGYLTVTAPEAKPLERDTASCKHCGAVMIVKPGTSATIYLLPRADGSFAEEPGAFCRNCMGPVCLRCHDVGTCVPFERWLERMEARR